MLGHEDSADTGSGSGTTLPAAMSEPSALSRTSESRNSAEFKAEEGPRRGSVDTRSVLSPRATIPEILARRKLSENPDVSLLGMIYSADGDDAAEASPAGGAVSDDTTLGSRSPVRDMSREGSTSDMPTRPFGGRRTSHVMGDMAKAGGSPPRTTSGSPRHSGSPRAKTGSPRNNNVSPRDGAGRRTSNPNTPPDGYVPPPLNRSGSLSGRRGNNSFDISPGSAQSARAVSSEIPSARKAMSFGTGQQAGLKPRRASAQNAEGHGSAPISPNRDGLGLKPRRASHAPTGSAVPSPQPLFASPGQPADLARRSSAPFLENAATSPATHDNLYKTEMCRVWEAAGQCIYGPKCRFAHGAQELRPVQRHPKYKTQPCKTFKELGHCPYGPRCLFIHEEGEAVLGTSFSVSTPNLPGARSMAGDVDRPPAPTSVTSASSAPSPPIVLISPPKAVEASEIAAAAIIPQAEVAAIAAGSPPKEGQLAKPKNKNQNKNKNNRGRKFSQGNATEGSPPNSADQQQSHAYMSMPLTGQHAVLTGNKALQRSPQEGGEGGEEEAAATATDLAQGKSRQTASAPKAAPVTSAPRRNSVPGTSSPRKNQGKGKNSSPRAQSNQKSPRSKDNWSHDKQGKGRSSQGRLINASAAESSSPPKHHDISPVANGANAPGSHSSPEELHEPRKGGRLQFFEVISQGEENMAH